ncbi:MAG: cation-translocating P-type ATPase, partial [Anaerolineales bacterium]
MDLPEHEHITLPIRGMDCVECTQHVKQALERLPGVYHVEVLLAAQKAVIELDAPVASEELRQAVEQAGYSIPALADPGIDPSGTFPRLIWPFFMIAGLALFVVIFGEWLGWFEQISSRLPVSVYIGLLILGGFPVFKDVARALLQRQITSHALMSIGVIASAWVGEWPTAVVIVLFMRIGNWVERQTTDGARKALLALVEKAPQMARVDRNGEEFEIPIEQLRSGDIVICRPGETVAADGEILEGGASLDTSAITGEAIPADVGMGSTVFAGSTVLAGGFRLRANRVGAQTTIGRVIRLVEEAESNKGKIQRFADRFTAYYLPIVLLIAASTYVFRRDVLASVAVLVVVCSCAIALATPIAMLASIGAAGKQGMLIKGGRYLEILPKVDVLLLDKTGTLTLGIPMVTDVYPFQGTTESEIIRLTAGVERFSEHPIGKAIRHRALALGLDLPAILDFQSFPGLGAQCRIQNHQIRVGNQLFLQSPEIAEAA